LKCFPIIHNAGYEVKPIIRILSKKCGLLQIIKIHIILYSLSFYPALMVAQLRPFYKLLAEVTGVARDQM